MGFKNTPEQTFQDAYVACATNRFETAVELLAAVYATDEEKPFEEKVLPGMLVHMHSRDQDEQATMLHWAAYHGSDYGVQELLKLGASPELRNSLGQSAIDVARSREHADVAKKMVVHVLTWSSITSSGTWPGWGVTELACLACLYHDDRFVDMESYLRRMVTLCRASSGCPYLVELRAAAAAAAAADGQRGSISVSRSSEIERASRLATGASS